MPTGPKLYKFQEQAVDELCAGKKICILPTGAEIGRAHV